MYFFWLIELVHIQYLLNGTTMHNDQNPLCVSFNKGETIVFFCTSFMSSAIFMLQKANELALRQSCISSLCGAFLYLYIREHNVYYKSHENHNKEGAQWWHGIWSYYVCCAFVQSYSMRNNICYTLCWLLLFSGSIGHVVDDIA